MTPLCSIRLNNSPAFSPQYMEIRIETIWSYEKAYEQVPFNTRLPTLTCFKKYLVSKKN